MKKLVLHILLASLYIPTTSTAERKDNQLTYGIYLQNNYGAPIIYQLVPPQISKAAFSLTTGQRVYLGTNQEIEYLFIKTESKFSSLTDLTYIIDKLTVDAPFNMDHTPVINIKPSHITWDIVVDWVASDNPMISLDLTRLVLKGSLGDDYAKKTKEILDYDYTKSTQAGFINLKEALLKKMKTLQATPQDIEDAKKSVDQLHRSLEKYRARDNQ
jgi:hypothetical protein